MINVYHVSTADHMANGTLKLKLTFCTLNMFFGQVLWKYLQILQDSFAASIILVKPEFNLREAHWLGTKCDSR